MGIRLIAIALALTFAQAGHGKWIDVPPIRSTSVAGPLGELEARMPTGHIYRDPDIVTWAHETTHGLNARIRQRYGGAVNAFYVFGGKACILPEPPITLAAVARAVPPRDRGPIFGLYLIEQQAYWNRQPLYVLDEMTAYMNGAAVGLDAGQFGRAAQSLQCAREMRRYAVVLTGLADRVGYDCSELRQFVHAAGRYLDRLRSILEGSLR